jgi:nitrate reductase cytochrome c-type subunit
VTHGRQLDALRQQLDEIFSTVYLKAHPEEAKKPEQLRWIPGRRLPGQPLTPHERYVVDGRTEGEKILLSSKVKKCLKCHQVEEVTRELKVAAEDQAGQDVLREATANTEVQDSGGDPSRAPAPLTASGEQGNVRIAKVRVPEKWLPYNRFDHQAHASIPELRTKGQGNWCVPCHETAQTSLKTDDVLLPSIAVCRSCHMESGGAQASCKSCHEFHAPKSAGALQLTKDHS